jgi:Sec-independent protein secretion pathway component TatC
LLSPPDVFTQLLIALPLLMLLEIAILIFIIIDEYSHCI